MGRLATNNPNGVDLWQQSIIVPKSITARRRGWCHHDVPQCRGRIAELRRAAALQRHQGPRAHADRGPTRELFQPALARCWAARSPRPTARSTPRVPSSPPTCCWSREPRWPPASWLTRALRRLSPCPRARRWASSTCSLRCRATDPGAGFLSAIGFDVALCRQQRAPARSGRQWQAGPHRAVAPMLPAGTESWSFGWPAARIWRRPTRAPAAVHATGRRRPGPLADLHYQQDLSGGTAGRSPIFSVIRTGKGDLDILSGGDFRQTSFYGIYTAGTQSAPCGITMATPFSMPWGGTPTTLKRASDPDQSQANGRESVLGAGSARHEPLVTGGQYAAWYPEQGGNVYRRAGQYACRHPHRQRAGAVRQARIGLDEREATRVPGCGGRAARTWGSAPRGGSISARVCADRVLFFRTPAGRHDRGLHRHWRAGRRQCGCRGGRRCGIQRKPGSTSSFRFPYSDGLVLAVGSTGRITPDGARVTTGGETSA